MTSQSAIVLLIGGGGLLQIVGVLLVVTGIRADRVLAEKALAPFVEPPHEPTYPEGLTDRDKATLELANRLREETIRPSRRETRRQMTTYDAALRSFLRQQLTGDIGARTWGVTLIVAGVAFATAGGVWAAFAST